ncbi:hypothetical protein FKM82_001658 [Ascaphus truei]
MQSDGSIAELQKGDTHRDSPMHACLTHSGLQICPVSNFILPPQSLTFSGFQQDSVGHNVFNLHDQEAVQQEIHISDASNLPL